MNLLRANTAVAAILCATIVLAFLSVLASLQAGRNQQRAEAAELQSRERLWGSYLAQARAARLSGLAGRSRDGLAAVRQAAVIRPSLEVRNEGIACLVLPDLLPGSNFGSLPPENDWVRIAPGLEICLAGPKAGPFQIQEVRDSRVRFRLDLEAAGLGPRDDRDRRIVASQFSPEARWVALSLRDGSVGVWETKQGRLVVANSPSSQREVGMAFTPDGNTFVFHDVDRGTGVRAVDLATGREVRRALAIQGEPFAFQPGTDELTLVDGNRLIWLNWQTGERLRTNVAPAAMTALVWSPDGHKLAATTQGNDTFLWNFDTGQFHQLPEEADESWGLVFSPDSSRLMSSFGDNVTWLYDCKLGREEIRSRDGIGLAFSLDGTQAGFFRRRGRLGSWKLTGEEIYQVETAEGHRRVQLLTLDMSVDGRRLATLQPDGIELWDLRAGGPGRLIRMAGARSMAFFPDGQSLLVARAGGLERRAVQEPAPDAAVRDGPGGGVSLGPPEPVLLPSGWEVAHVALSGDGRTAALDLKDRRMALVDLAGAKAPVMIDPEAQFIYYLGPGGPTGSGRYAISPDGRWLAVGYGSSRDAPLVFDGRTGGLVTNLHGHGGTVAFSPDGKYLMVGGGDGYMLYRAGSWERVWVRPDPGLAGQWGCMAFDRAGRWVALASRRHDIQLLTLADGSPLATLTAPQPVNLSGVRVSSDGTRLVATTHNNLVQFWDLEGLRRHLGTEGLDWADETGQPQGLAESPAPRPVIALPLAVALTGLAAASVVAILALLVLRRHQSLAQGLIRTEERSIRQERELEVEREVSRLKSNFVSMVSHEFRTPLSVILSSAEILRDYLPRLSEEKRQRQLGSIVDATQRMKELIGEVLLLGKVESGRLTFQPRLVEVLPLCEQVAGEVAAAQRQPNPITVANPQGVVCATIDQSLVEIILSNLLSNAVKYSPEGSPVALTLRQEGSALVFEVKDRGIGIPAFDRAELFQPFRRGSNVGKLPGSGLGLAIVRRCVEQHGGKIDLQSAEGAGTTVTVWLPAH